MTELYTVKITINGKTVSYYAENWIETEKLKRFAQDFGGTHEIRRCN